MLHELLFALSGCPGDIFILNEKKCFIVDESLPFISGAELAAINDILVLGTKYYKIRDFLTAQDDISCGKYKMALCGAIETCLESYEMCVERLELDLLEDAGVGIAYVCHAVRDQLPLLQALELLCDDVTGAGAGGCQLLDVVRRHVVSGVGQQVVPALQLIENSCWRALYSQLVSWLVYGLLVDPAAEFFIRQRDQDVRPATGDSADTETDGVDVEMKMARLAALRDWQSRRHVAFELRATMLPSCLPQALCDDILFVGNTIHLCRESVDGVCAESGDADSPALSILEGRERELSAELAALGRQVPFSLHALQTLVARAKKLVSEHLWRRVVVSAGLLSHLHVLKRFLLAGDGALFDQLFVECDRLLSSTPTSRVASRASLDTDVNAALLAVCGRLAIDDDLILDNVCLSVEPCTSKPVSLQQLPHASHAGMEGASGWDRLRVSYAVPWPLHMLLTPVVFSQYNRIFSFLLLVKRTQWQINSCWLQILRKSRTSYSDRQRLSHVHTVLFLVNSVQHYVMLDAVQSQFCELVASIQSGNRTHRDYLQLQLNHHQFLGQVSDQCFLHATHVLQYLCQLLVTCRQLVLAAVSAVDTSQLYRQLHGKAQVLFRVLSSKSDQATEGHLTRLLHRLDFNHHFSSSMQT